MRGIRPTVLAVCFLCIAPGLGHAFTEFTEEVIPNFQDCGYGQFSASYAARGAKYSVAGVCINNVSRIVVSWTAQGNFLMETGQVEEKIVFSGPSPWRGEYRLSMVCAGPASFDPWLTNGQCTHVRTSAQGSSRPGTLAYSKHLTISPLIAAAR